MLPMKLDTVKKPSALTTMERKQAAHRPETLNAHYELARRFLDRFPSDGDPFTHEAFDQWGIDEGRIAPISPDITEKHSPEWVFRGKQRHELKQLINFGGMSPGFQTKEKFQLDINEHGKSCRVVSLMTAIRSMHADLPANTMRRVRNHRRDLELMISAIGIGNLTLEQRLLADQALRNSGNYSVMLEALGGIYDADLRALERSLEIAGQGDFMAMIEGPKEE